MSKQTFRLNRKGSSIYALFVIEDDKVTFRKFRFYTGPMDEEREMSLEEGRELYQSMVAEREQFLPHDNRMTHVWIPVQKGAR